MSKRSIRLLVAGALLSASACAAPGANTPPAAKPDPATAAMAAPPFTADQIRQATPVGRSYRFRISRPDEATVLRVMKFTRVDEKGCTVESTLYGDDGAAIGETTSNESSWQELVGHASYPAETTVVTDVPCTVPAGVFRCKLYTVSESKDGLDSVTRAFFATKLPGAPVKLEVTAGGKPVTTWTLLEHQPPPAPTP